MISAEIRELNGQRSVVLEQLNGSATTAELKARAQSELRLESEVDWNLRDDHTGRILRDQERVMDFADRSKLRVQLTMQPDAGLG
jgi:hypothetical protein